VDKKKLNSCFLFNIEKTGENEFGIDLSHAGKVRPSSFLSKNDNLYTKSYL
jgi:hypothetical protein